eukprot:m.141815 g.141815  ORF g.141815 m.141815 type:complete len:725 (-) comp30216_c0_seq2:300-2474(-)
MPTIMMKTSLQLVLLCVTTSVTSATEFDYKHNSGSASEFPQHKVTTPIESSVYSDDSVIEFSLDSVFTHTIHIDSAVRFSLALIAQIPIANLAVSLVGPDHAEIDLWPHGNQLPDCNGKDQKVNTTYPCQTLSKLDDGSEPMPGAFWIFPSPKCGTYTFKVSAHSQDPITELRAKKSARAQSKGLGDGLLVIENDSKYKLMTEVLGLHSVVGQQVGLEARMFDNEATPFIEYVTKNNTRPTAVRLTGDMAATMWVVTPTGKTMNMTMTMNADGSFSSTFTATEIGEYQLQATVLAAMSDTMVLERTSSHMVDIGAKLLSFGRNAVAVQDRKHQRLKLFVPVRLVEKQRGLTTTVRPYAEIWCASSNTAVTFATNLADVQSLGLYFHWIDLEVDMKWLAKAGCNSSIELRNLYLADTISGSIHDTAATMSVFNILSAPTSMDDVSLGSDKAADALLTETVREIVASGYDGEITSAMKHGIPTKPVNRNFNSSKAIDCDLVLVHGYCADRNPFELDPDDWTNVCYYSAGREGDKIANENDDFAKNVLRFIDTKNVNAYSMMGQSQGGMVTLHILNHYHTGMDLITEGRKIQSIATPFLGNSAFANLGWIVDIIAGDCKVPTSLSREGATEWISGITQENIEETNVYWTKYDKGGLFGEGWCNQLMNVFLQLPNDGATEVVFSNPGANSNLYPEVTGQCHAEDMEWLWSVLDSGRNKEINAAAGRNI